MRTSLDPEDPSCPERLRTFLRGDLRLTLTVSRPLSLPPPFGPNRSPRSVAIVGARKAELGAQKFAQQLAAAVVEAGGVVLSGGALGIDNAAHEGALDAGGVTWCVAPFCPGNATPQSLEQLYERVEHSAGGILWTLPPDTKTSTPHYHRRNEVLVTLADLVIVIQADRSSGTLSCANKALGIGRAVRVARPPAWDGFAGSKQLLRGGVAKVLESIDDMRELLELPPLVSSDPDKPSPQLSLLPPPNLSPAQLDLLQKVTQTPQHMDEIAHSAGLRPGLAATLLLTLALENVVVEGPSGFFRRQQLL